MNRSNFYYRNTGNLKRKLRRFLSRNDLRSLHEVQPHRHFLVLARLVALAIVCSLVLSKPWPLLWFPAAILQGFNIFGFTILLHEQVHGTIFRRRKPRVERYLGLLYALPAVMSATQFRVWHLAHHNELGSMADDPSRVHISPRLESRWQRLLNFTPFRFWIYFFSARSELKRYSDLEIRLIKRELILSIFFHLSLIGIVGWYGGTWVLVRTYFLPLFVAFPMIYMINQLGHHYDIDPDDPAKWTTRIDGNVISRFLFLWSNFHAEHHYYQKVPFYNLKSLNKTLSPFYEDIGHSNRKYGQLLWHWLVEKRSAHSNWSDSDSYLATTVVPTCAKDSTQARVSDVSSVRTALVNRGEAKSRRLRPLQSGRG